MAKYRYAGPGPAEDDGEIVRPGDEREFDAEPASGPWELVDEPERGGIESEADPADVPEPKPEPGPEAALTPDELAALKKTADAELATPAFHAPAVEGM